MKEELQKLTVKTLKEKCKKLSIQIKGNIKKVDLVELLVLRYAAVDTAIQDDEEDVMPVEAAAVEQVEVAVDIAKCGICLQTGNNVASSVIRNFEIYLVNGRGAVPFCLKPPVHSEDAGNDICSICYEENGRILSISANRTFAEAAVQTDSFKLDTLQQTRLAGPIAAAVLSQSEPAVVGDNQKEGMVSKRPYPGKSVAPHLTAYQIRNSPVRPTHLQTLQAAQNAPVNIQESLASPRKRPLIPDTGAIMASPAFKRLRETAPVASIVATFEKRVQDIQEQCLPGSPKELRLSHFGVGLKRD